MDGLRYLEHFPKPLPRTQTSGALVSNEILGRIDDSLIRTTDFAFHSLTTGAQSPVWENAEQVRKSESLEAGKQAGQI